MRQAKCALIGCLCISSNSSASCVQCCINRPRGETGSCGKTRKPNGSTANVCMRNGLWLIFLFSCPAPNTAQEVAPDGEPVGGNRAKPSVDGRKRHCLWYRFRSDMVLVQILWSAGETDGYVAESSGLLDVCGSLGRSRLNNLGETRASRRRWMTVNGDTGRGPESYQLKTSLVDYSVHVVSCVPPMLEEAANRGVSDWRPASNEPWKPPSPHHLPTL